MHTLGDKPGLCGPDFVAFCCLLVVEVRTEVCAEVELELS